MAADILTDDIEPTGSAVGRFTGASRRAAIRATLPVLATWFSSGHGWATSEVGLQRYNGPLDTLLAGLWLRAATASSRTLLQAAEVFSRHPTFRYQQQRLRTTDFTRGTLDLSRLATSTGLPEHPRKYPVIRTHRSTETPENLLAAWVASTLRRDLRHALELTIEQGRRSFVDEDSNDRRQATASVSGLDRLLQVPALRDVTASVRRMRRSEVEQTVAAVERRISRRELLNREVHAVIVGIANDLLAGTPGATAGGSPWDFYDESFDARLFELWFLNVLSSWLADRMPVEPESAVLRRRAKGAYRGWRLPHLQLDLFYQKAPGSIDVEQKPRWEGEGTSNLTGIPDITATIRLPLTSGTRWALIDPKLRQRTDRPTEELFKLLGYFDNYDFGAAPHGAIIYYAPGDPEGITQRWSTKSGGQLLAVGVDPDEPRSVANAAESVGALVLRLAEVNTDVATDPHSSASTAVDPVAQVQEATVAYLLRQARELGPSLKPSRRQAKTALGASRWRLLDKDTRRMIATALHLANQLDPKQDHSGPILGLCAAAERILRTHFTQPVVDALQGDVARKVGNATKMLGAIVLNVGEALDGSNKAVAVGIRDGARVAGVDLERLRALLPQLSVMNQSLRIPAAHIDVLSHDRWERAWELFMVHTDNDAPLMRQVVDAAFPARIQAEPVNIAHAGSLADMSQ